MNTISKQIERLAEGLLKIEPEVGDNTGRYSMFNDGGVECEVGEFLYGLVRMTKPEHVLETGTHKGIGAAYIGMALKANGNGGLTTLEFLDPHIETARRLIRKLNLDMQVQVEKADATTYIPNHRVLYDIIFLDTEPNIRFGELIRYFPYLKEGGYIFIHDTPRTLCQGNVNPDWPNLPSWPFGDIPHEMRELVKSGKLRPFHFNNPRGLIGFYKIHNEDVKW